MKVGDQVKWINGVGIELTGTVIEAPRFPGGRPVVRESRLGTILRPMRAQAIEDHGSPETSD